jgi:hypothetical protein
MLRRCWAALALLICVTGGQAAPRSAVAKADFQRQAPCPATGLHRGKCPGYVIDHIVPLCAGGPDAAANMQWQTVSDAKVKDRKERRQCRRK